MSDTEDDVLVLGAGAIGVACAYALQRAGRQVRVLDRGAIGGATSYGNCGTLTPSHAPPLQAPGMIAQGLRWMWRADAPLRVAPGFEPRRWGWLARAAMNCRPGIHARNTAVRAALLLRSRALIEEWIRREHIDCDFEAAGTLYVYRNSSDLARSAEQQIKALAPLGIDTEVWDAERTQAAEPCLLPGVAGALFNPQDAHLRPDRFVEGLAEVVRRGGGGFELGAELAGWELRDGRAIGVRSSGGVHRARDIVVALGPWQASFVRGLGLELPIEPGKGYSITYAEPPPLVPRRPLVLKDASVCVTTWAQGFRLGSTMEFAGFDASLNRRRLDALVNASRRYLREPEGRGARSDWFGWRPMSPDDLPIIDRAPSASNVVLAGGHGMLGMSLCAVTAELVAAMLEGSEPGIDTAPLSATRFGGVHRRRGVPARPARVQATKELRSRP